MTNNNWGSWGGYTQGSTQQAAVQEQTKQLKVPEPLVFDGRTFAQACAFAEAANNNEMSLVGYGTKHDLTRVVGWLVPKQTNSPTETDFELADVMEQAKALGIDNSQINCWLHSHARGAVCFSGKDYAQALKLSFDVLWCIVINVQTASLWRGGYQLPQSSVYTRLDMDCKGVRATVGENVRYRVLPSNMISDSDYAMEVSTAKLVLGSVSTTPQRATGHVTTVVGSAPASNKNGKVVVRASGKDKGLATQGHAPFPIHTAVLINGLLDAEYAADAVTRAADKGSLWAHKLASIPTDVVLELFVHYLTADLSGKHTQTWLEKYARPLNGDSMLCYDGGAVFVAAGALQPFLRGAQMSTDLLDVLWDRGYGPLPLRAWLFNFVSASEKLGAEGRKLLGQALRSGEYEPLSGAGYDVLVTHALTAVHNALVVFKSAGVTALHPVVQSAAGRPGHLLVETQPTCKVSTSSDGDVARVELGNLVFTGMRLGATQRGFPSGTVAGTIRDIEAGARYSCQGNLFVVRKESSFPGGPIFYVPMAPAHEATSRICRLLETPAKPTQLELGGQESNTAPPQEQA